MRTVLTTFVMLIAVGCGGVDRSETPMTPSPTTSTSSGTFTCKVNGVCYTCPSSQSVTACLRNGAASAGCTRASASACP